MLPSISNTIRIIRLIFSVKILIYINMALNVLTALVLLPRSTYHLIMSTKTRRPRLMRGASPWLATRRLRKLDRKLGTVSFYIIRWKTSWWFSWRERDKSPVDTKHCNVICVAQWYFTCISLSDCMFVVCLLKYECYKILYMNVMYGDIVLFYTNT